MDVDTVMKVWASKFDHRIEKIDKEINSLVRSLGGAQGKYQREKKAATNRLAEIYSPPRISAAAKLLPSLGCLPGFALDLTTNDENGCPWNFDKVEQRRKAWELLERERPMLLVGTPMCTAFSTWQAINDLKRDPEEVNREKIKAMVHLKFCCQLYEYQAEQGIYFPHEHPSMAASWDKDCIKKILRIPGVKRVLAHQCQYQAETKKGEPIKKPTGFMTNCRGVAEELCRLCTGKGGQCSRPAGGRHAQCSGMVARQAAVFPFELCKAVLMGFSRQMKEVGCLVDGVLGLQYPEESNEVLLIDSGDQKKVIDAMTGQELPYDLVMIARKKEMDYFKSKGVWAKRTIKECLEITGRPPVTVKWVETNKGDDVDVNIRARLVARQIRGPGQDSIFAPTPPLEALRTILSLATTNIAGKPKRIWDPKAENRTQISFIDISRAYFNAKTNPDEPTYVQLPPEDPDSKRGMCGLLKRHMYGTQGAADGWQQEYSSTLIQDMGFKQGLASPCIFVNEEKDIVVSVHGDDFTAVGPKNQLDWYEAELEKHYELRKGARIGPGPTDDKEATVLNRIVRWGPEGVEYEADPRQCEKLIEGAGLEGANSVATPGIKTLPWQIENDKPLPDNEFTKFRNLAARANYLAADRPDVQYAAKEVCRSMAAPTELSMQALKRLVRYLIGHPRMIFDFKFQEAERLDCYSDTDWAGCPKTRKSTSGGALLLGEHVLKTWSSTQPNISLSSGEAEFYGVVKATGIALGHQSLMQDLGIQLGVTVHTDSSAAMGVCARQGLGKLRHIATHTLWVQEKVRTKAIDLRKVDGTENPADLFTKHLPSKGKVHQLIDLFGCRYAAGRAASAPRLRKNIEYMPGEQV